MKTFRELLSELNEAAGEAPVIGKPFGGGFYAGVLNGHHIIVSPKNKGEKSLMWKLSELSTSGTDSKDNGVANTAAMANKDHPAALFCSKLSISGKKDWYLPSLDELEFINKANKQFPSDQKFGSEYYWSSTQHGQDWALAFLFDLASDYHKKKSSFQFVRAIRRVKI